MFVLLSDHRFKFSLFKVRVCVCGGGQMEALSQRGRHGSIVSMYVVRVFCVHLFTRSSVISSYS